MTRGSSDVEVLGNSASRARPSRARSGVARARVERRARAMDDRAAVVVANRGESTGAETSTPKFVRVWDYASARASEIYATTEAIGRARGRGAGAHSLARHLRRRATSHAPRVVRRRPNLKRRRGDGGDAFRRCRRAVRRRGRLHDARVVSGDGGGGGNERARTMRTHTWHAKR